MRYLKKLSGQAPLVFVLLTGLFLALTGTLRFGGGEASGPVTTAAVGDDGHGHSAAEHAAEAKADPHAGHADEADPHAGHGHEAGEHGDETEADPHADEADPHADEADPHADEADPHADEADPHADEADPHAGHGHEPGEHGDEAEIDPHAGHDHAEDWCDEHGVPESACTRCNPGLVAAFKERGDWCAGHGLPESQCTACGAECGSPLPVDEVEFERLSARRCEHGTATIKCDDCRFELGVVKVDPSVSDALLEIGVVEEQAAATSLRLTGEVRLDPTRVFDVAAPAAGRILELFVDLGERVAAGDRLAVLHSGEIGAAKAAFLEVVTDCEISKREKDRQEGMTNALDALLASLPSVSDRASDGGGSHGLLDVPDGLVGAWKSKLVGAASRLRAAELGHERELSLEAKGISARAEHEEAHQSYEAAKAEYAALIEEVKLTVSLENLRMDNAFRHACAKVVVAEQRLRVLGLDGEAIRHVREEEAGGGFAQLTLKAPRAGTVTALDLSAGHFVEANESLFTIADLGHLWVWCDLYERDLARVDDKLGSGETVPATIRVASFPGKTFGGTLDLLGSEVDIHTRTIKARIRVGNPGGRLRPGMFAGATIHLPESGRVKIVPRTAVLTDEGDSFIFVHLKDDLWVRRDVEVRGIRDDHVEIDADLPVGMRVATGGAFMLKSDVLRAKMGAG